MCIDVARRWFVGLLTSIAFVVFSASGAWAATSIVYAMTQVDAGPNKIYAFRLNSTTGALTLVPGFPINSGGNGTSAANSETVAFDPLTNRLYVINDGTDTLSVFSVSRTSGTLTSLYSPVPLGVGSWGCVAVHPSGSPVIVGDGNGFISSFTVTASTATQAAGSPYTTSGAAPFSCAFSKDGLYAYTGGNAGVGIASYSVSVGTGVLTPLPGSPFTSGGGNPVAYATDSSGRIFSTNAAANQVRAFTTPSGVPTAVAGNPFSAGGLSVGVAGVLHPNGFYMVADRASRVGVYQIGGTGAATTLTGVAGSPFLTGGSFTDALVLSPDGKVLAAANGGSRNFTVFTVNPGTGVLTSPVVQPLNSLGTVGRITGVAITPAGLLRDFDADYKSDVLLRNKSTGQNIGWLMSGTTVANSALLPAIPDTNWEVRGIGDFDADGKADVILRNKSNGQNIGWLMNGLAVSVANFLPTIAGTNWEIKGVGDFNGDGKADVLWRNSSTGQNIGWLMDGLVVSVSAFLPTIADTNWKIVAVGDLDGNGKADVILRNSSTGQNIGWLMDGLVVSVSAFLPMIADTNWEIRGAGDFDGDGKADIIWRNKSNGQNIGWRMNGLTVVISAFLSTIADTNWEIKAVGDTSGDGKADVVWRNKSTGLNIIWLMDGLVVSTSSFLPAIADTNWEFVGSGSS